MSEKYTKKRQLYQEIFQTFQILGLFFDSGVSDIPSEFKVTAARNDFIREIFIL